MRMVFVPVVISVPHLAWLQKKCMEKEIEQTIIVTREDIGTRRGRLDWIWTLQ